MVFLPVKNLGVAPSPWSSLSARERGPDFPGWPAALSPETPVLCDCSLLPPEQTGLGRSYPYSGAEPGSSIETPKCIGMGRWEGVGELPALGV